MYLQIPFVGLLWDVVPHSQIPDMEIVVVQSSMLCLYSGFRGKPCTAGHIKRPAKVLCGP
jgi:hypothetical protein